LNTGELFAAVAEAVKADVSIPEDVKAEGRELRHVLQSLAPGAELPELRQLKPRPDEVLRRVLNVFASDLTAQIGFADDGPVVVFTPLNPVAAMLLNAHDQASISPQQLVTCTHCGKGFIKGKSRKGLCATCVNTSKVARRRAKKKRASQSQSKSTNPRSVVNG
jgi:hypothetical protein